MFGKRGAGGEGANTKALVAPGEAIEAARKAPPEDAPKRAPEAAAAPPAAAPPAASPPSRVSL